MVGGVPGTGGRYRLDVSHCGSIVPSRSGSSLTALPRVEAVGYRHRRLRELGEGRQVLEAAGRNDPPDMAEAVGLLAGVWEAPVLAAYVSESHCAQLHGALPGAAAWSTHLPYPADSDCGYLHRPATEPGGTIEHARALVTGWAEGAGLSASDARLDLILRQSEPPVFDEHHHDRDHDHTAPDDHEEPPAWEVEAIRPQCDVYASLYGRAHSPRNSRQGRSGSPKPTARPKKAKNLRPAPSWSTADP